MHQIARCFLYSEFGKFILVRHKGKNTWVLPGGHIEKNETIIQAIKREVKEELGINIKLIGTKLGIQLDHLKEQVTPICMYKIEYEKKGGKKEKRFEYIFLAKIKKSQIIKTQIDEIEEFKFFSIEEICSLENTYIQVKEIAKKLQQGKGK